MSTAEFQFRSAGFGGFNRQDVLAYLDKTLAEHAKQAEELSAALRRSERQNLDQGAELAEVRARAEHLEAELDALRARLGPLEADAAAYGIIREKAGAIELEARTRAQTLEDEARATARETVSRAQGQAAELLASARGEAEAVRAGAVLWLDGVRADYDRLRTDVETTVCHVAGELGRVQEALGAAAGQFARHDEALERLGAAEQAGEAAEARTDGEAVVS